MTRRKLTAETLAEVFKALAEPSRLEILSLLSSTGGEQTAVWFQLNLSRELSQPTVSHHLAVLHDAGLLVRRKEGRYSYFALSVAGLNRVREALGRLR